MTQTDDSSHEPSTVGPQPDPGNQASDGLASSRVVNWVIGGLIVGLVVINVVNALRPRGGGELVGQQAPGFTLPEISTAASESDSSVSLSDYRGEVILLDFWASWCKPCHEQARNFASLQENYPKLRDEFRIIAVNGDQPGPNRKEKVRQRLRTYAYEGTAVLDDGKVQNAYGISTYPTLVVVGPDGVVDRMSAGVHPADKLAEWIRAAR
jgi:thiol-disulfide isomerase/thioredoxin